MSTRSSRRIASRRQDAMEDRDKDGAPSEPGQQHASAAPEGFRDDTEGEEPVTRQRRPRPARRRQHEPQRAGPGQHGSAQEELFHSSAGPSDAQAAQALAGLHGDFAGQRLEAAEAAAAHASAEGEQRPAGQAKRAPPRSPPKPGRPPLPSDFLRPQVESMHGLPSLPTAPPASVPYPSLEALASIAEGIGTSGGGEAVDTDEGDIASQQGKRRAAPDEAEEGLSETEGEGGSGDSRRAEGRHKRPRLVWTAELHARFMNAVNHLGVKNAVPKTILQLMNVEGMTRENVASHLQKYRLYLKRMAGYPPAARLPLDTLQQVQQAIQQQGHPPLFQQNIGGVPAAVGIGFPGFLPASSGMGPAAPQWRPPVMPVSSEGTPASEGAPVMQPFPWLGAPIPAPGGFQPGMGVYGQVPAAFNPSAPEGGGAPPGYGWFWGMMGAPNASGMPAGPPAQSQTAAIGAGQPAAVSTPQRTPHAPSPAQTDAAGKVSAPESALAAAQSALAHASHAQHAHPGIPKHEAAARGGPHPALESHVLHAAQGHSRLEHHPRPTLLEGSRTHLSGTPAGQAAHILPLARQPTAGQATHALPTPAHTSALVGAQAQSTSLPIQPPQQGATAVPTLPFGAALGERPGQRAEQPGVMPGPCEQHAQHAASQVPHQETPADSQQEAAQKPSVHDSK